MLVIFIRSDGKVCLPIQVNIKCWIFLEEYWYNVRVSYVRTCDGFGGGRWTVALEFVVEWFEVAGNQETKQRNLNNTNDTKLL